MMGLQGIVDCRLYGISRILRTAPCDIADVFGVCPQRLERLLTIRGWLRDGESIRECLERIYGNEFADIVEKAIDNPAFSTDTFE